ncbi:nephrin [Elysia marginata]|uniref:Nephrin n=1 Tax=Elysia marginata TaxID=1093978 RepID=A0AAV4EIE2_9GAST|nr:nephrin [Elysia marginata]
MLPFFRERKTQDSSSYYSPALWPYGSVESWQHFVEIPRDTAAIIHSNVTLKCVIGDLEGIAQWTKAGQGLGFDRTSYILIYQLPSTASPSPGTDRTSYILIYHLLSTTSLSPGTNRTSYIFIYQLPSTTSLSPGIDHSSYILIYQLPSTTFASSGTERTSYILIY